MSKFLTWHSHVTCKDGNLPHLDLSNKVVPPTHVTLAKRRSRSKFATPLLMSRGEGNQGQRSLFSLR